MVIIQLAGGLGNQMFQYALYLQLKSLGREVKIDDVSGFSDDVQRTPALSPFGIVYERPSLAQLEQMLDASPLFFQRVRRKLFGRRKKAYFEEGKLFLPEVLTWDDIYLEGYWQTEKYFRQAEEQVREAYDTDRLLDYLRQTGCFSGEGSAQEYLEEINNTCSVSVHIRRGDYLTPENQALFGGLCTDAYYIEGIRQMRERYPGCRFFLFTNDRAWAKEQAARSKSAGAMSGSAGGANAAESLAAFMRSADITWVDLSGAKGSDYIEFVLMSRCKHHILANSSFSWWASYLNTNPDKTVLAPESWMNGVEDSDFYRADMQRIRV